MKKVEPLPVSRFETILQKVSPSMALKRWQNRVGLEVAKRQYEAAQSSSARNDNFSRGSADNIGGSAVVKLRDRGRYFDENFDLAAGVLDTSVAKIVGTGIKTHPMAMLKDGSGLATDLNKFLNERFLHWSERPETTRQCNYAECQRLLARSWLRDGDAFTQLLQGDIAGLDHSTTTPLSLELLESDYVPMTQAETLSDGRLLRYGVITDSWGKPLDFVVYTAHPGDSDFTRLMRPTGTLATNLTSGQVKTIDAENMLHLKLAKRIRQTRGVSVFATVFNRLEDVKDYEESERMAARIGSYIALQITKSADYSGRGASEDSGSPRSMDWVPGMIFDQLVQGEEVKSVKNERPSNQLEPFRDAMLRGVAAGTGTGFSSIAKKYDNSYSAQRQELVENEVNFSIGTERLVSMACRPIYQRFVRMEMLAGNVPRKLLRGVDLESIKNAAYRGPAVAYIDPLKELRADIEGVQAGFFSKSSVVLKRGGNPADTEHEIEQERQREDEHGIVSTTNPKGSAQLSKPVDPDDEDEDEKDDDQEDDDQEDESDSKEDTKDEERGRRGRRGRRGAMPSHEWDEAGQRIRFEIRPGEWGDWSSPGVANSE